MFCQSNLLPSGPKFTRSILSNQQVGFNDKDVLKKREAKLVDETSSVMLKLSKNYADPAEEGKGYRKMKTYKYVNTPKKEPCHILPSDNLKNVLAPVETDTTTIQTKGVILRITTITNIPNFF